MGKAAVRVYTYVKLNFPASSYQRDIAVRDIAVHDVAVRAGQGGAFYDGICIDVTVTQSACKGDEAECGWLCATRSNRAALGRSKGSTVCKEL